MYKVAIITRTKNRPLFLERAIKSVDSQTYKDYIHIVLNDGGDTAIVDSIVNRKPNKNRKVIHNEKSVGLVRALNQAIRSTKSKYITILDDDDTWPTERLEKTVRYMDKYNEQVVVVKMDIVSEEVKNGRIIFKKQYPHPDSQIGEISLFQQCAKNYISNGVVTYTRSLFDKLGGYNERFDKGGEDWDFGIRIMLQQDVVFLRDDETLFFYHQRTASNNDEDINSVHRGGHQQEQAVNQIRNYYLRNDIQQGVLGIGYIMNSIADDENNITRLEAHINRMNEQYHEKYTDIIVKEVNGHTDLQLASINPRKILKRLVKP